MKVYMWRNEEGLYWNKFKDEGIWASTGYVFAGEVEARLWTDLVARSSRRPKLVPFELTEVAK